MKINKAGYLFASGPGGIWLFNPAGSVIARVHTGQRTSNCAFGKDEKELFMTCDSYVMRLKLK
jgi:gluconolactonase